jgi:pilus assembly protein CpaC
MPMIHSMRRPAPLLRDTFRFALAAAVLGGLFGLAPLGLADARGAEANHLRIGAGAYGITQRLEIGLNKSLIVDLPADVHEVIVTQPGIAAAIMRHKRRAIIQGAANGGTNILFLDAAGEIIAALDLAVRNGAEDLATTLARIIEDSDITVQTFDGGGIVLSGTVQSGDDRDKALAIAAQFAGDAAKIANALTVAGSQQVMLKVTIAEVQRAAAKQLGINLSGSLNLDGLTTSVINNRGLDEGSAVGAGGAGRFDVSFDAGPVSIDASLRALASRNAVRFLAEPTLTALSGRQAEFLVGGQFPIQTRDPVTNVVTTEFKDFGVQLDFTPVVRSDGIIGLEVGTEVSEVITAAGQLNVRRANTSVELPSGSTLAIGGLIQDSTRQQISKLPGLGDIPVLGALFRSRDFIHSRTELVILVTPYLVEPRGHAPRLPTDDMVISSDAEAIFLGRMEALYGVGEDGMRGSYDGSIGFALD